MDFARGVSDLAGPRSEVLRSSYWDDPIAVGRIQLALNVKVVSLINLGGGKYEIIRDELPGGVTHFAPDNYVVVRYDGSHYELMTGGSGGNSPQYDELTVEIIVRIAQNGFFAAIRDAPIPETHMEPKNPCSGISVSPANQVTPGRPEIEG